MPAPAGAGGFFHLMVINRWFAAVATLAATLVLALGLWSYQAYESRRQLESYMNEYIEMRNITERIHALKLIQSQEGASPGALDSMPGYQTNPFAPMRPASFENPFRPEGR